MVASVTGASQERLALMTTELRRTLPRVRIEEMLALLLVPTERAASVPGWHAGFVSGRRSRVARGAADARAMRWRARRRRGGAMWSFLLIESPIGGETILPASAGPAHRGRCSRPRTGTRPARKGRWTSSFELIDRRQHPRYRNHVVRDGFPLLRTRGNRAGGGRFPPSAAYVHARI